MTRIIFALLAASTALCVAAPPAQAEDILTILERQADMPPRLAPDTIAYSYTMTLDLKEIKGKDISEAQAVLRVDPTQPGGSRAQILSSSNPDSEALQGFLTEIEDPEKTMAEQAEGFWCGSSAQESKARFDTANFTVISEDETQAIVRPDMAKLAELLMQTDEAPEDKSERKMMKKLMERIDGQITLSKPHAEMKAFKVNMTRPLTMMVVAKLKAMDVEQNCALAPNGFYHMASMKMHVDGKALGKKFGQDMNIQITQLTALPE